jgi:phosphoribosyl 1,2-cyclic phosphodiesterase
MARVVEVQFWGTRGSIPTPGPATARYGGNTSCVELRAGEHLVIFDAGTGLRPLGLDLLRRAGGAPIAGHLLISHTHWDHIQGFPFFVPAYGKPHRFDLYGPPGIDRTFEKLIRGQMDHHYFPVEMTELAAQLVFHEFVEPALALDGLTIRCHFLHHPTLTLGYRVEVEGRTIVYATDHELYRRMYSARGDSPAMLDLADRHDADFAAFVAGADLYIADTQYAAADYGTKIGWGHSTVEDIAALAARVGVKRLALYHHDPLRTDADVDLHLERARAAVGELGATACLAAREGETISL